MIEVRTYVCTQVHTHIRKLLSEYLWLEMRLGKVYVKKISCVVELTDS